MQAIQNTVRRSFTLTTLLTIKAVLLRACRRQVQPQVTPGTEPVPEIGAESAGSETDDTDDRFAAWESVRDERLHEAEECERQGLRLLSRAALLHAAVRSDDRGETFIADELREHAEALGKDPETIVVQADTI